MSLSLLLLVQAATTPAVAPYPSTAGLEAFGEACRNVRDLEQVETDLVEQQWTAEIPADDSPLGKLLAVGRAGAAKILDSDGDTMSNTKVYTKTIKGERLDVILSSVQSSGRFVNGCRMYDVNETRKIETADARTWIGREPDRSVGREEIFMTNWAPGYAEGHNSFEIFYVPEGSPIIALTQFHGLALKADFVGETEQ